MLGLNLFISIILRRLIHIKLIFSSLVGDNEEIQIVCKKKDLAILGRDTEEVGGVRKGDKRMTLRGGGSKVSQQSEISQVFNQLFY